MAFAAKAIDVGGVHTDATRALHGIGLVAGGTTVACMAANRYEVSVSRGSRTK